MAVLAVRSLRSLFVECGRVPRQRASLRRLVFILSAAAIISGCFPQILSAQPIVVRIGPRGRVLGPALVQPPLNDPYVVPSGLNQLAPLPTGTVLIEQPFGPPMVAEPFYGSPALGPKLAAPDSGRRRRLPPSTDARYFAELQGSPLQSLSSPGAVPVQVLRSPPSGARLQPVPADVLPASPQLDVSIPQLGEANFQLIVPEAVANRLLSTPRTEMANVRDRILQADVVGRQVTVSTVQVDFRKSSVGQASATLVMNGTVEAETLGTTPQATVATAGHHRVRALKDILFDGKSFTTRSAVVYAKVFNQNIGASTNLEGVPLLGPISKQIAVSVANAQRRQSDPIAWQKIASTTFNRFNGEVDNKLAEANEALEKTIRPRLRAWSLMPDSEQVATTDQHLIYTALFRRGADPLSATPPSLPPPDPRCITIRLHESLLNQAAGLLKLEGQRRTEKELTAVVEQFAGQISGIRQPSQAQTERKQSAPALSLPIEPEVVFADEDPLRFRLADGVLTVILQLRFEVGGKVVIPNQRISIPYKGRFDKDQFLIERGQIELESTSDESQELRRLYEPILRARLENSISDLAFPRKVALPPPLNRRVGLDGGLHAADGWLTVSLTVE